MCGVLAAGPVVVYHGGVNAENPPVSPEGTCTLGSSTGRRVLAATLLASAAAFIVWSAVSVALPAIQSYFNTNVAGIQWVVNAYLLTLAAFLLIGGSLGDHFGRKRIFVTGMAVFAAGALGSGFARSLGLLVGLQAVQGLGAALMVPQSLAIISACFPEGERGRAIGAWAGISGGIAALGPWLGGWLVDSFGWPAVFWMVVPVVVLAMLVTLRYVPENRDPATGRLDWPGTLFVFLGLFGIAFGLIKGPADGWTDSLVLGSLVGGAAAMTLFLWVETKSSSPLVPLGLFRNPLVSGANGVTLLVYFAFNGVMLFTILDLQQIQGYSATQAGVGMLPPIIIITLLAAPAGTLADRFGPRLQMIGGPLLVAAGMALLTTGGANVGYFRAFLPGLVVMGVGMAFVIAPLTKSALSVDTRFAGAASGINNAIARTASLLAVAVLGVVMLAVFAPGLRGALPASGLTSQQQAMILSQQDKLGGIEIPDSFDAAARAAARTAIDESFVTSYRWTVGICAALALLGSVVSFLTIRRRDWPVRDDLSCEDCVKQRGPVV